MICGFVFLTEKENNCEHKLEHVTNQLWILVNWK